jgi:hypothetical protein
MKPVSGFCRICRIPIIQSRSGLCRSCVRRERVRLSGRSCSRCGWAIAPWNLSGLCVVCSHADWQGNVNRANYTSLRLEYKRKQADEIFPSRKCQWCHRSFKPKSKFNKYFCSTPCHIRACESDGGQQYRYFERMTSVTGG